MAFEHKIVKGPGFFDLLLSLAEGKKVRFTTIPYGREEEKWGWEVQLLSWGVLGGCHGDRKIEMTGKITAKKNPKNINFRPTYLEFKGWFDARGSKGEMTPEIPYPPYPC